MKKILLILFLIPMFIYGQNHSDIFEILPIKNNDVVYTSVVKTDSIYTKDVIYNAAKKWYADLSKNFLESESNLKLDNREDHTITIQLKVYIPDYENPFYISTYSTQLINLQIKDGRYKYTIDGIFIEYALREFPDMESGLPVKSFLDIKSNRLEYNKQLLSFVDKKIKDIITSLEKSILDYKQDDNW